MSSPKRAAKAIAVKSSAKTAKPARRPVAAAPTAKPRVAVVEGASADAKRVAAVLERSIVDGKLYIVSAEALQKLIAAACRVYTARVEAGEAIMPVPKNRFRHDRNGHGERIVKGRRSRGFRARHVAELDGTVTPSTEDWNVRRNTMDLIADRGRRVTIEELNTRRLLAHARKQAVSAISTIW